MYQVLLVIILALGLIKIRLFKGLMSADFRWIEEEQSNSKAKMFHLTFQSREKAAQFYEEWMTEVFSKIPPEDLLVYDVKQGWDPLCRFLNIPVPNVPFPRVNESADIQTAIRNMKVFSWTAALGIPILTLGLGYFVWKMLK